MTTYVRLLGTAGTKPTSGRNVTSLVFKHENLKFLIDVGEGTTRQLLKFDEGFDIDAIFITHGHGDHVWGLPGLIQCMTAHARTAPLGIYCTQPTYHVVDQLLKLTSKKRSYEIHVCQVTEGVGLPLAADLKLTPLRLNHSFARTVGYVVSIDVPARLNADKIKSSGLKGKDIGLLVKKGEVSTQAGTFFLKDFQLASAHTLNLFLGGDTRPVEHKTHYDLMIHECTFPPHMHDEAVRTGHSTVEEVLSLKIHTNKLVLNHLGERVSDYLKYAQLPPSIVIGHDGLRLEVLR